MVAVAGAAAPVGKEGSQRLLARATLENLILEALTK
ncbi:hypothetical protein BXY51_008940 [Actinoplanes cyaneus]|nr:hypothetical protein [Actinoplanes cyaneus]